jgi:hypothetical protein
LENFYDSLKNRFQRNLERTREIERPVEVFANKLWPWSTSRLILLIGILAVLDYLSTYAFLNSGNKQVVEGGLLAGWALYTGGYLKLLLVDFLAVGSLIAIALGLRSLYTKLGFQELGRTALIFLLTPYLVTVMAVVFNNIFWSLI